MSNHWFFPWLRDWKRKQANADRSMCCLDLDLVAEQKNGRIVACAWRSIFFISVCGVLHELKVKSKLLFFSVSRLKKGNENTCLDLSALVRSKSRNRKSNISLWQQCMAFKSIVWTILLEFNGLEPKKKHSNRLYFGEHDFFFFSVYVFLFF